MANLKSCLKRRQFCRKLRPHEINGGNDRISDLPDEILSSILAKLTLKEAISTSILSKRWIELWVSYPILDFEFLRNIDYTEILVHRVNQIVEKYNGGKLHKFRIVHGMSERFKSHIEEWISFATRNCVSELELDFGGWGTRCIPDGFDDYWVPLHVFAREEMMVSNRSSPNVVRSFVSLRDLRLKCVNFSDQVFDIILYNCSSLEIFHVTLNHGLVNAKNTAPHLKLKSLKMRHCYDLKQLELLAPNLVSFKYKGCDRSLCINAQQLVSLSLSVETFREDVHTNFILNQFSPYLPMLESLFVSVNLFKDMSDFTGRFVFSNLKTLVLDATNHDSSSSMRLCCQVAAFIISASPYLELLELDFKSAEASLRETVELELPSMSTHKNLKEVKLCGFKADVYVMDFLAYLVECSVSLQKINITAYGYLRPDDAENCNQCVQELRKFLNSDVQLMYQD